MTKSLLAILMAALGLTMSAHANLGDTPNQSARRYGQGCRNNDGTITYVSKGINIIEDFQKIGDRWLCVCIRYTRMDASDFTNNEVLALIGANSDPDSKWTAGYQGVGGGTEWNDGAYLYAKYFYADQVRSRTQRHLVLPCVRIATNFYMKNNGKLQDNNETNTNNSLPI